MADMLVPRRRRPTREDQEMEQMYRRALIASEMTQAGLTHEAISRWPKSDHVEIQTRAQQTAAMKAVRDAGLMRPPRPTRSAKRDREDRAADQVVFKDASR